MVGFLNSSSTGANTTAEISWSKQHRVPRLVFPVLAPGATTNNNERLGMEEELQDLWEGKARKHQAQLQRTLPTVDGARQEDVEMKCPSLGGHAP